MDRHIPKTSDIDDALNFSRTIFETSPVGIIIYEESGQAVMANPAAGHMVGASVEQLLAQNFRNIGSWKPSGMLRAAERALTESGEQNLEVHIITTFGKDVWLACQFVPFQYRNKKHLLSTFTDVTARRAAETALRKTATFKRNLIAHLPHRIFIKDLEFKYISCNLNYADELGINPEEIVGKDDYAFHPKALADAYRADDQFVMTTGRIKEVEERYISAGKEIWIHTIKVPFRDESGKIVGVLGTFEDITDRKLAVDALQQSEERFRQLAEHIAEVFYISNLETSQLLFVSPAYETVWGRSRQALYDNPHSVLESVHPEDRNNLLDALETQKRVGTFETQYRIIRPDGSIRWIHDRGFPIFDKEGKLYRVAGIAADITKFMDTQNQLIRTEKLAALGQMAAGIVHEINSPIGYVTSNLHILHDYMSAYLRLLAMTDQMRKNLAEANFDKAIAVAREFDTYRESKNIQNLLDDTLQLIKESQEGLERVRRLIGDLKGFSRADTGDAGAVAVEEVIKSALNIVQNELKYKCELVENYAPGLTAKCSMQRLSQVIINLLLNAAQAIDKKGTIAIRTYREKTDVCIDVQDDGCGIPAEIGGRIFDPFFTTKPEGKGTGLGLSISYDIVKQYGGDIKFNSAVGRGTTFTVTLPAINQIK